MLSRGMKNRECNIKLLINFHKLLISVKIQSHDSKCLVNGGVCAYKIYNWRAFWFKALAIKLVRSLFFEE